MRVVFSLVFGFVVNLEIFILLDKAGANLLLECLALGWVTEALWVKQLAADVARFMSCHQKLGACSLTSLKNALDVFQANRNVTAACTNWKHMNNESL